MRYCARCVLPDTRPNSVFSPEGVCAPCQYSNDALQTNFRHRLEELRTFVDTSLARLPSAADYTAVVGVSGGKDSTRQALWVREKLKIQPLLVSISYPSRQVAEEGPKNLANLISQGFDAEQVHVAPRFARRLFREAFFKYGNPFKATEIVLFSSVQKVALRKQIPLIFWGENPALQIGDSSVMGASIWDGNRGRDMNTLQGGEISWIRALASETDVLGFYEFPPLETLEKSSQVIYLGPAWPDWSGNVSSMFSLLRGFTFSPHRTSASGDIFNTEMIDEQFIYVNNLLRYYKYGFGRASEQTSQMIRQGLATRELAAEIAERLDSVVPDEVMEDFFDYLEIDRSTFWTVVRKFGNPDLFDFEEFPPRPRFRVGVDSR